MAKAFQIKARIKQNKKTRGDYFHLVISADKIAKRASPGQFVNIKAAKANQVLLRRPFSIHRINGSNIGILYETVGKGTKILSQKKVGEFLDIIGPLGNGFDYDLRFMDYGLRILVAGGMGVAPLIFLAKKLAGHKTQNPKLKTLVLIGAKTKSQVLCEKEFKNLGCSVKIATDDGSSGFRGYVSDLLAKELRAKSQEPRAIYACGPRPMLREISALSKKHKIPAQISLEEHMACGIGACLGCVVKTQDGYKRVCKEGPVFEANQIIWGKE